MYKLAGVLGGLILSCIAMTCDARGYLWAGYGQPLHKDGKDSRWVSADGAGQVYVGRTYANVVLNGNAFDIGNIVLDPKLTEVGWSAAVKSLFVDGSDAGQTGDWRTRVFVLSPTGAREVPVLKLLKGDHSLQSDCHELSMLSVGWIESGSALLAMKQVPNSSGCSNMAKVLFYVIDISTNSIREVLTPATARMRYAKLLGPVTKSAMNEFPNR